jgi:hypothetical protein
MGTKQNICKNCVIRLRCKRLFDPNFPQQMRMLTIEANVDISRFKSWKHIYCTNSKPTNSMD